MAWIRQIIKKEKGFTALRQNDGGLCCAVGDTLQPEEGLKPVPVPYGLARDKEAGAMLAEYIFSSSGAASESSGSKEVQAAG